MSDKEILEKAIPIQSFPEYGATKSGQIIRLDTGNVKKYSLDYKGYPRVSLYRQDKAHYKLVHRLLAEVFIPNPDAKPIVHHIDGDPLNYSLSNLMWVTASENVKDGFNRGRVTWNKGLRSIDSMTLEDLAKQLPRLQKECKALWGDEEFDNHKYMEYDGDNYGVLGLYTAWDTEAYHAEPKFTGKTWQYHVQMMVVDPDPIAYLGRNI